MLTHYGFDRGEKPIQLGRFALDHQTDSTVGQILHKAGHLKPRGHLTGGEAEAHSLDSSLKQNIALFAGNLGIHAGQYRANRPTFLAAAKAAHEKLISVSSPSPSQHRAWQPNRR